MAIYDMGFGWPWLVFNVPLVDWMNSSNGAGARSLAGDRDPHKLLSSLTSLGFLEPAMRSVCQLPRTTKKHREGGGFNAERRMLTARKTPDFASRSVE